VVIDRWECRAISCSRSWIIDYGRRKTGKTFLLQRCLGWDLYVTVTRTRSCVVDSGEGPSLMGLELCMRRAVDVVSSGGTVVIDEFQRLPDEYWELIAAARSRDGRAVLCGSSVGIASRVFDRRSPLLGLLEPLHIDLASAEDTVASLAQHLGPRDAVLWAVIARDPWILGLLEPAGAPWRVIASRARSLVPIAVSLVGEVFTEEEKQLTRLYDAVLRLLAQGYWSSKALAQKLYKSRLISSPQPGIVTGLLAQLERVGLVEKIPLWRTRGARLYYRHRSPLLSMLLGIGDIVEELGSEPSGEEVLQKFGLEAQFFVGEILAKHHRLVRAYTILPHGEGDVDIVLLTHGKKPVMGYEVKLGSFSRSEARRAVERMKKLGIPKSGLVSLVEKPPELADEVLGPEDLVEIARVLAEERRKELCREAV